MTSRRCARSMALRPRSFAVGKFELTFDEWAACVAGGGCASNKNPSDQGWGKVRRPVINVSWNDSKEYVAWRSGKTGKTYRLLSEAEWEYAARGGTTTKYAFGDTISKQQAQFSEGSLGSAKQTVEVGRFPANKFGLHDMHGSVWSGARITGIPVIKVRRRKEQSGPVATRLSAFCAAVPGTTVRRTSARPTVAAALPAPATTLSASVWPER